MSSVRLEPARLVTDGDALYGIAATLSSAVRSCERALGSTGGMAGDDESAEVYAHGQDGEPGYDQYAVDVLKGALGLANALKIVDSALNNSARAYDGAQLVGAFKSAASSSIPEANPTIVPPSASVPTSLGKGPEGPLGEFGDFLKDALAMLGVVLPSADTGKLGAAESAWSELSGSLSRVQGQVDSAFTNVSAATLPQQGKMLSCQRSLSNSLGKVSESASSMAGFARSMIDSVNQAWEEIGWFIAQMAVEIAIEIGLGALLGMVTFGAGAAAMAAKIALTVTRWALKIAALCKKLRRLVMIALRAARLAIRAGVKVARETISAGLASGITTISFNTVRGALDPNFQPQNVLNAALSAAAGGAAGGGVSRIGAGRLTDNVANNGLRRATHIGVETGAGAVDGLASGLADAGLNGTPFSPLSSMAAGALLGGALSGRPGGAGGPTSSAPSSPSGAGVSTPDSSNIPSGTSTGGSSNNGGGAGPIDISDNTPTPGGGDAGSTTADSGGGVDIPSDSPTPGGGDGGSSGAGDGGGLDLPTVDAPSSGSEAGGTGTDAPASPDAPSTPDAPSGDAPSTSPDAPAVDAPTSPDAPSTDAPTSSPDAPTADAPTSPDAPSTDAPTSAPDAPTTDAPSSPEAPITSTDAPSTDAPTTDAPAADAPTTDAPASAASPSNAPDAPTVDAPATSADVPSSSDGTSAAAAGAKSPAQHTDGSDGVPAEPAAPASVEPDGTATDAPADPANPTDTAEPADATDADATDADATDAAAASATAASAAAAAAVLVRPRVPGVTSPTAPTSAAPTTPGKPTAPTGTPGHPESPTQTSPTQSSPEQPAAPVDSSGAPDAGQPEAPDAPATPESSNPAAEDAPEASESTDADQGPKPETIPVDPSTNSSTMDPDAVIDLIRNKIINPNFTGDPNSPFSVNCGSTASTLNSILRGDAPHAAEAASRDVAGMEADTGVPQIVMTPSQIEATLQHLGPGSHAVVGVVRNSGMGHWFVAYNHNGNVVTLDAQTGMVGGWPPAMGNVRFGHAGFHPSVVEAATGTTPELQPWSSHQNGVETPGGAAHPSSGLPDLGNSWNPPYTPPPNLTGTPSVAAAPAPAAPAAPAGPDAPVAPTTAAPTAPPADAAPATPASPATPAPATPAAPATAAPATAAPSAPASPATAAPSAPASPATAAPSAPDGPAAPSPMQSGPATAPSTTAPTTSATLDASTTSAAGADAASPGDPLDSADASEYGAREQARTPQNAREQELTDRWKELVDAQNGANSNQPDLTPEQRAQERQALVDGLLSGNPPVLSVDANGDLRMHEALDLSTACPADCDAAEMDRQFSDANSVLSSMSVAEWVERRARFINHPADYRSVSGSAKVQAAEMRSWVRNRVAEMMAADPTLSKRDARNAATLERRELNATHRLDMVAGGNPQDISGMGGRVENNKIGNIFKNDFVPQMEQHVLDLLERVPPSLWNEIRMNITIGNVT